MSAFRTFQAAFNAGEFAPSMIARQDSDKYAKGLAKCRNFLIEPQGPVMNRPGFVFVNKAKTAETAVRLIPFVFSTSQTMVLEFGDHYIRFHTQGRTLMKSATQPEAKEGDVPYEVETPYSAKDIFDIHYVQSADVLTLVHPNYAPRELRRYSITDWRLVEVKFISDLKAPTNISVVQTINDKVTNKEDYEREYAVTALSEDGKFETEISETKTIKCNPYGDGAYNTISWTASEGADKYRVYRNEGGIWAYIGETNKLSIRDENITADSSITPPRYDDVFQSAKGIASVDVTNGGSGYPSSGIGKVVIRDDWNPGIFDFQKSIHCAKNGQLSGWSAPKISGLSITGEINISVEDEAGVGKGAVLKGVYKDYTYSYTTREEGPASDKQYYYGSGVVRELTRIEVINPGSDYVKPKLTFTVGCSCSYTQSSDLDSAQIVGLMNDTKLQYLGLSPKPVGNPDINKVFEAKPEANVELVVEDSTGYGAELEAVVKDGKIIKVIVVNGGMNYSNPQIKIISPSGSGAVLTPNVGKTGDYPSAVTYFEQRRWFGGSPNKPNNIWATKTGTESNMTYSLPSQDTDRINVAIASRNADRVRHLVPLQQLMLLTPSAEWRVSPLNSDAITPSSMSVRPQSYIGANNVQPLVISSQMVYAADRGGHLRELGYNYQAGGYISNDMCLTAAHLFDGKKIVDLAYAKAPIPIIYAVSSDGRIIAMTYVPEQMVGACSTIETEGTFESVCVVAEGDEDVLYAVVKRTIGDSEARFIERMNEQKFSSLKDCIYLDCAGTYRGEEKTEITGIHWLEGMTVRILADGSLENDQVVKDGKIVLAQPASIVHVGLPYSSELKTLPIPGEFGTGIRKNVRKVFFSVVNSSSIKAGPSFESLSEYQPRGRELAGDPPMLVTDDLDISVKPNWNPTGQICVRQENPLPLKVCSMTAVVEA